MSTILDIIMEPMIERHRQRSTHNWESGAIHELNAKSNYQLLELISDALEQHANANEASGGQSNV